MEKIACTDESLSRLTRARIAPAGDTCILSLFERQVAQAPDAVALVFDGSHLTYAQLDERANVLARFLRSRGVGAETFVGLCCERSIEMVIAILGILKAGGAYVPLDPHSPGERLAFILKDTAMRMLLTQRQFADLSADADVEVHFLDADFSSAQEMGEFDEKACSVTRDTLAYAIYTSGSTGKPKGVLISHGALLSHVYAFHKAFEISRGDRIPQFANISFDITVEELFPSLLAGATVVLKPDSLVDSPAAYLRSIKREQLTIINLTASYWHQLVQEMTTTTEPLPSSLRLALIGAEKVSPERLRVWQNIVGDRVRWYNVYGPTEATVTSTCYEALPQGSDFIDGSVPIGFPLVGTGVYVLNQRLEPVAVGSVGELCLSGQRLARGYLHCPDLTAERFIPHPYSADPGERLYKTGDLVRTRDDGALEFLGRIDQQIKLRGFRIEPGEIETALAQYSSIQEVVVTLREGPNREQCIIAYFTTGAAQAPTSAELRAFLRTRLPSYMLPTVCMHLEALPLNQNGKVDVRALPTPDWSMLSVPAESASPFHASPLEELLSSLWQDVLGLAPASPDANFFESGGHSLLATRLLTRIRQVFSVELSLREFFLDPTFLGVKQAIEAGLHCDGEDHQAALTQPAAVLIALPRSTISAVPSRFPLSFAQQRLWFLEQIQPFTSLYNVPLLLRLDGPLHPALLQRSLEDLVERHESLRTSFDIDPDNQAVQCIYASVAMKMSVIDVSFLPVRERDQIVDRLVQQEAELPFDLGSAPLLRTRLLRLGSTSHVLLLTLHHIVCDGWSIGILMSELAACYRAHLADEAVNWKPLKVQYADYACWQRTWLSGAQLEPHLAYWRHQLAGAPELLNLPTDQPRPQVLSSRGATLVRQVPAPLYHALQALARREQVTPFMLLLAAFATLLGRSSGQEDLVVGTPIANRQSAESEAILGFLVNTLPLRVNLAGDPSFVELLARVREMSVQAYAHQDVPFELVVEALHPRRELSYAPVFQVLFVLHNTPLPAFHFPHLSAHLSDVAWNISKFDLTLTLTEEAGELEARFEYSTDLFAPQTMARWAEQWLTLLEGVVQTPARRLSMLPLLSQQQREAVLQAGLGVTAAIPEPGSVIRMVEEQVQRSPDALAVVGRTTALSYAALDRLARQLAHLLHLRGVGAEQRVGLCLPRSPELVVALCAVLKAGGAYVPLDPTYPTERLSFMIEQADISLILTVDEYQASLSHERASILCLDREWVNILQQSVEEPAACIHPDILCYIIYTSGSTGKPKGVCLQHRALVNLISWQHAQGKAEKHLQRTIQFSSLVFDPLFQEVFSTLSAGGTLVLPTEQIKHDPERLLAFMDEQAIERIYLPFAALRQLAEVAQAEGKILPALGEILTAGEQLQATSELRAWLKQQPHCRLYNYYGPSETHVITSYLLDRDTDSWSALPPIGQPIDNSELYVLDATLNPVPPGVVGELYAGGLSVGRGYANAPHLTAERFIPDPFSACAGALLYKTGDLVRYLPDGNLAFLGRVDTQVKIRGYRVEPGEIEALLREHPQVRDGIVIVDSRAGESCLLAYLIEQEGGDNLHAAIHDYLKERLPAYMLPASYVSVEEFPLTSTGKIDRQALLQICPVQLERNIAAELVLPRNDLEQQLCDIWRAHLHIDKISIFDNFFELGGHSLLATRIALQIRQTLQAHFALRTLFAHPTIAELAKAIVKQEIEQTEEQLLQQLLDELERV